ncbi:MAG: arginine--tRNA ligase [Lachnospiraceae bacterium]|nr:arginine--tRNA ligase [Lachnospiraceae bacterium]MBQ5386451.1 arginine--tRNA ligase [Lachnospiraceae bacterium]
MREVLDLISEEVVRAFEAADIDAKYAKVGLSNRPDLCEYQCNGAMAAAKEYHKAPIQIATAVCEHLSKSEMFASVEAVNPGFLNLKLSPSFLADYVAKMGADERLGLDKVEKPKTIMIDYGGPNVAKALHVGHLRSAVIGESIKRIGRFMGNEMIGDVHMGDWGLQMGLIICELQLHKPELPYYDESFTGSYPEVAPFTVTELADLYTTASAKSKENPAFKEAAMQATYELQHGRVGYQELLKQILSISVADMKANYEKLDVSFELWKGESDAQPYIPDMVAKMKEDGYAYESEGALVVDVKEETDTKEVPPCMILKSDGASLYNTTDLATLVWRMKDYHPDKVIYVVDKRQELYFTQVFRCAKKTGIVPDSTELQFVGFGTMNGKDGKPFKTRQGGVMRLSALLQEIHDMMYEKIMANGTMTEDEAEETAKVVALSAVKYGDLSNQAAKDYIFDMERFTSSEGNTGPYILYTIVRIKSILNKFFGDADAAARAQKLAGFEILAPQSESEKSLMLELVKFNSAIRNAYEETAPHKICAYIYDVANAFNHFYHETKILAEEDEKLKENYIRILEITRAVLEQSIDLLGFKAPERM